MDRTATRFALWVLLGTLLLQAAWVLALPPFRGVDEFDHAYRAASVADGQWLPSGRRVPDGRGELVGVPPGLVEDAGPVCEELAYTGRYNCEPVPGEGTADEVQVASAASRYDPVFYWVLGTAAQPFDGAAALTAMRLTNAVLCALLAGAGAWVTARWSRTVWPRAGYLAALTPVTVYGGAVAAPNAVEAVAALALWACLVGLRHLRTEDVRRVVVVAAVAAVPLAGVRGLGPLWLALVVLLGAAWLGPRRLVAVLRAAPGTWAVAAAVVVATTAASAAWTLLVGSLELEPGGREGDAVPQTLGQLPLWLLQTVAAFPTRKEQAPTVVYAAALLVLAGLLAVGLARGRRWDRGVVLLALVAAVAVPVVLQVQAFDAAGLIWQGRYGWPVGAGVLVLAGAAVEERVPRHRLVVAAVPVGALLWAVAHVVSVVAVQRGELRSSPWAGEPGWLTAPVGVVGAVAALGALAWAVGMLRVPGPPGPTGPTGPTGTGSGAAGVGGAVVQAGEPVAVRPG